MNTLSTAKRAPISLRQVWNYIDVLKPRETALLTFIALCAAVVGAEGHPEAWPFVGVFVAVLLGSGGCNGLTNYLDRNVDAIMTRTCRRAIPSQRIHPPEKVLPFATALVVIALILAYFLHPLCFAFGLAGTVASLVWRKRAMCVIQGTIAGCAPVLIGYLAINPRFEWTILFMCLLIAVWIPLHVWSVMIARREDYVRARIAYFPLTMKPANALKLLSLLSIILYAASLALWHAADFGWLFFAIANIMGAAMVWASIHLLRHGESKDSWRLYKLSSFPYLGLIFLAMCLNFWL